MKSHKAKIAERLRKARDELGITQTKLAKMAGIGRSAVVHYETAGTVPGGIELIKLSNALKVTPNYLLSGSESFLPSSEPEHSLATDDISLLIARLSACILCLDTEVREKLSELVLSLVKQKLDKREFEGLMLMLDTLGPLLAGKSSELESLVDDIAEDGHLEALEKRLHDLGLKTDEKP